MEKEHQLLADNLLCGFNVNSWDTAFELHCKDLYRLTKKTVTKNIDFLRFTQIETLKVFENLKVDLMLFGKAS